MGRTGRWAEGQVGRVTEVRHEPGARYRAHRHLAPQVCFVMGGELVEHASNGARTCPAASIVFLPPSTMHGNSFGTRGAHCLGIEFVPDHFSPPPGPTGEDRRQTDGAVPLSNARLLGLIARLYSSLELRRRDFDPQRPGVASLLEKLVLEVEHSLPARSSSSDPEWLRQIDDRLEAEFARPPSLESLAAEVGFHPVHVSKTYRRVRGRSLRDTVRERRVTAAAERILGGDVALGEIAYATGFSDQSHLTRVFKRSVGLTPGRFRTLIIG